MSKALRYNQDKPELSYILTCPNALREFAKVCEYGANKYARGNYLKGAPFSQYTDCALRHLLAWWNGEERDKESECLHLAHLLWNVLMLLEMSVSKPENDDRIHNHKLI